MTLATQVQAVVVGWQVYDETRDPLSSGCRRAAACISLSPALLSPRAMDVFGERAG
jgi:hypothetical protein